MSRWLVEADGGSFPRRRIVCLPYAGGGASVYASWRGLLPPDVGLSVVRLPGRESRFREQPLTDVDAVVDQLASAVAPSSGEPWALFGYSLGALLAYELAVRLEQLRVGPPALLLVGGAEPPHLPRRSPPLSGLPDEDFISALSALEGTPQEVFDHHELLRLVLPTLRADFTMLDGYRPRRNPPLACPIVTYSGEADRELDHRRVSRWSELTSASTMHRTFAGGHFFINDQSTELVATVHADLVSVTG